MARIVIDARIINSSTGRYIERLLHHLEDLDQTNEYLLLVRAKDLAFYRPRASNFKIIEADFADYSFAEQLGLAKLLYSLKPDLVHFCMPQQPLGFIGTPIVTTIHDLNLLRVTTNDSMGPLELRLKKLVFRVMLYIVAKRSRHVITPTEYTKHDLLAFSHIKADKVAVTYEAAEPLATEVEPFTQLKAKDFIMVVGQSAPYKNNRGLIAAHQLLLKKYPRLHLVIVGKHDAQRTADEAWVQEQGYKNVIFPGFVADEQVAWLYKNCRAYVFPSFMEGFGLPALEAMLYGAPVVSSNATCLPEVYGDAAHYFNPADTPAMADAIEAVMTDTELRDRLINNGAAKVRTYSWQRMAEQTHAVYMQALGNSV